MAKRKCNAPKWKQFEDLVALIERLLTGANATITPDDHIIDRYGNERQVDVSVRIDTGTTELLMIFECRNRGKVADVTWIEQVYTKKDNLRADRAILVSNKPMSVTAQQMARDKGIEIRSLREIGKSLLPLTFPNKMEFKSVKWHPEGLQIYPRQKPKYDEWRRDLKDVLQIDDEAVYIEFPDGQTFNFRELVQKIVATLERPIIAPDAVRYEQEVEVLPGNLTAKVKYGKHEIDVYRATVLAVAMVEIIEPTHSFIGDYSSDTKQVDHLVAQTTVEHAGNPLSFSAIGKRDENKFLVNIPYGFMDENVREGIDPQRGVTLEISLDASGKPTMKRMD
jgi:hypothetical protein